MLSQMGEECFSQDPKKEVWVSLQPLASEILHCRDLPGWCRVGSFQHEAIHSLVMAWPKRSQIGLDLLELDSLIQPLGPLVSE